MQLAGKSEKAKILQLFHVRIPQWSLKGSGKGWKPLFGEILENNVFFPPN
jgi:hypothetical protein